MSGDASQSNSAGRRVRCEALGKIVSLPGRPRRIVSLTAGYTETFWHLGLAERVVGVSAYCGRYVDVGARPVVGDYLKIDDAAVAALRPDLVLMTGGVQLGVARRLAAAGLPVYVLPLPDSLAGIIENIRRIGALAGEMTAAHALTERMEQEAAALRETVPAVRLRVYGELWFGRHPRMVGGLTFVHDLMALAGGENVWADAPTGYLALDLAKTAERQPEVVVIFWEDDDTMVDAPGLMRERGWTARLVEAQLRPGQILIHDGPSCLTVARWLRGQLSAGTSSWIGSHHAYSTPFISMKEDHTLPTDEAHADRMKERQAEMHARIAAAQEKRDLLIVNTGNGKGKSTAAFGLLARNIGHGRRSVVVQFVKSGDAAVARALKSDLLAWHRVGEGFTWDTQNRAADIASCRAGWALALAALNDADTRFVLLDELNIVLDCEYLPVAEVVDALKNRASGRHVVVTGRNAPPELIAAADLVTEMGEIKHPFNDGVKAQVGVEF